MCFWYDHRHWADEEGNTSLELRTAITIMIFFYYRLPLLILAGCRQLNICVILNISKDYKLWQLGFLQKGTDCMFFLCSAVANLKLFFCHGAYKWLEDNVWVRVLLFFPFPSPILYWFHNKWIQHSCSLLSLLFQLMMPFC